MGVIKCPVCGEECNDKTAYCPQCGCDPHIAPDIARDAEKAREAQRRAARIKRFKIKSRTREELRADYRADPDGAARAAYHPAGWVWSCEPERGERYFRWRADPNDSFEDGLPTDDTDRRDMLTHEVSPADVPAALADGWYHFRFCTCRLCAQPESGSPFDDSRGGRLLDNCLNWTLSMLVAGAISLVALGLIRGRPAADGSPRRGVL
jgi:hypothetical protein